MGIGPGRLRLPAHRASSAMLAGAYPFLAPDPPSRGVYVGVDAITGSGFCADPWTLYADGWVTNPNLLLAGVIGQGKSALAKTLTMRGVPAGRQVYVPGDPKGEWAPVARAVGGTVIRLGPGSPTRINPLDGDSTDPLIAASRQRLLTALAETTLRRGLRPVEHTSLHTALATADATGVPVLGRVVTALADPDPASGVDTAELRAGGVELAHGLRRLVGGGLGGMFDAPSTIRFDQGAPMLVLDLSALAGDDDALAVAMTCASAWVETALAGSRRPRWVVYDEAWRLLTALPLVRRMQAQWKLSRAYGIANLLILHRLSDLDAAGDTGSEIRSLAAGLLADCSIRVIYRQEVDQLDATARALGLTGPERELLPTLDRGTGLWRIGTRAFVVRHRLHPDEHAIVDTDVVMRGAS